MADITLLLTTFAGLGLPRTLAIPFTSSRSVHDAVQTISARLPETGNRLIITTTDNKQLLSSDTRPVIALLPSSDSHASFLPLRLSARLCGGKGGFGSQLRAAGGRMSSRKKRDQNQNANGSSRNLDGRRLRTVDEAKRLGALLSQAEKAQAEKDATRKKELEAKIQDAENRLEMLKSGKLGGDKGRLDAAFVEGKEQAEEKMREAVRKMGAVPPVVRKTGSETSMEDAAQMPSDDEQNTSGSSADAVGEAKTENEGGVSFWGFDVEYDEDDDDDEHDDGDVKT